MRGIADRAIRFLASIGPLRVDFATKRLKSLRQTPSHGCSSLCSMPRESLPNRSMIVMVASAACPITRRVPSRLKQERELSRLPLRRLAIEGERLLAGRDRDLHGLAVLHLAGENQLGERVLHGLLDHALQGTRAIGRVIA